MPTKPTEPDGEPSFARPLGAHFLKAKGERRNIHASQALANGWWVLAQKKAESSEQGNLFLGGWTILVGTAKGRRKGPTRFPLSKERGGGQPKKGVPPNRRDSSRFIWVSCLEGTLVSFLNKDTNKTTFHFVGFPLETDLSAKQRFNRDQHRGARLASVRAGKGDAFSSGAPRSTNSPVVGRKTLNKANRCTSGPKKKCGTWSWAG